MGKIKEAKDLSIGGAIGRHQRLWRMGRYLTHAAWELALQFRRSVKKWEIRLDFRKVIRYNDCKVKGRRGVNFEDFFF